MNKIEVGMNYFNVYYPFLEGAVNPFGYTLPTYSFEAQLVEQSSREEAEGGGVKVEECAPRAEKSHPKILSRIKKLIKELHHEGVLNRKTHWSSEEDELLQKLVEQEKLDWKMIPHHFSSRSQNMCYSRYRRIKLNSKEKKWTQEEEQVLVKLVAEHGEKWKRISQELTKYTPKQIRERYLNYLRPNIDKSDFTVDEDLKICKFVIENGKHWRRLEESLPGRPEGSIKGRYYAKLQELIERAHEDDD